jgi:hypothetical protein
MRALFRRSNIYKLNDIIWYSDAAARFRRVPIAGRAVAREFRPRTV